MFKSSWKHLLTRWLWISWLIVLRRIFLINKIAFINTVAEKISSYPPISNVPFSVFLILKFLAGLMATHLGVFMWLNSVQWAVSQLSRSRNLLKGAGTFPLCPFSSSLSSPFALQLVANYKGERSQVPKDLWSWTMKAALDCLPLDFCTRRIKFSLV